MVGLTPKPSQTGASLSAELALRDSGSFIHTIPLSGIPSAVSKIRELNSPAGHLPNFMLRQEVS
jgi:hypothetical protein